MAVKYGNRCVYEKNKQDKVYKDMGTTISLLYEENNMGYIISIGDSRVYEVKDNNIEQLTEDDTYVNALVRDKIITREEAAIHPEKHVLLKAIGVTRTINFDVKELGNIQKRKFLLCTDGLTNMVSDNKILEVINNNKDRKENICKNLIEIANINGGKDNITVIYIEI
jgi:protein phosphatase